MSRRMSSSDEEDSEGERKRKMERMRESESGEAMFGCGEERERWRVVKKKMNIFGF